MTRKTGHNSLAIARAKPATLMNLLEVFKATKGNKKTEQGKEVVRLNASLLCFIKEINFIAF
jgi:hypothetical protein